MFAEFETNIRRERQLEGIRKAKTEGVYTGRKATLEASQVRQLADTGLGHTAIAKQLSISRSSVYRLLGDTTPLA